MSKAERIAAGSIGIGALVLALKATAWWLTGSAALYSDALESIVNVVASAVALWALRVAAKPADANHTYGHDKAEFFAAVVEGVFIVVAAVSILQHAWASWQNPVPFDMPGPGIAANFVATLINAGWGSYLLRQGRALRSAALTADGRHVVSDVVTSVAILAGVAAVLLSGRLWLDPLIAAAAAVHVLWSGMSMISQSAGGLMDAAPAADVVDRIRRLVADNAEGAIEAHDLRTRYTGKVTFVEFHMVVPGSMAVAEAHAICDRVEAALKTAMQGAIVTIHVEPEGKAKHHGVIVL
ncbi:MAG: cation transporter [Acetobacteraceae bacterium]|nr:cation transporter [Acetobacteraceae bacterium]